MRPSNTTSDGAAATSVAAAPTGRSSQRARRVLGRSLRVLWALVRIAVIVGAIGIAAAWHGYGYVPVAVETGSMTPTYPVHTLLFVHNTPASDIRVGDVITFDPPGRVPRTTHRVVRRTLHEGRWYFETKGDGNPVADDWRQAGTTPEQGRDHSYLRGVSYPNGTAVRTEGHLPYAGWFAQFGGMTSLRHALVLLPFLIIALQLLSWIWRGGRAERTPGRDELDSAATESEHAAA